MERKRCQVCEGPIANNRCRLCGMPYRNDETLYHLNENRSEHYRHATSKARAIMRQEEVPLGDKKPVTAASQRNSSAKKNAYNQKNTYNQKTTYNQKNVNQRGTYAGGSYKTKTSGSVKEKKKHPQLVWLILLCIFGAVIPEVRDIIQEVGFETAEVQQYEIQSADVLTAGDEIPAGHYMASCRSGEIQFMIVGDNQESGILRVDEDKEQKITLNEGDMIGVISATPSEAVLILTSH